MKDGIGRYLSKWQRIYNRRRLGEAAVALIGYGGFAAGIVVALSFAFPETVPVTTVAFVAGLVVFGACAFAFIERREGRLAIATRSVPRGRGTRTAKKVTGSGSDPVSATGQLTGMPTRARIAPAESRKRIS